MSKKHLVGIILLLAIRGLFDLSYMYCIVPEFGYEGYKFSPDLVQYTISWLLYLLVFPLTRWRLHKVSDAILLIGAISVIAPLTSLYGLSGKSVAPVIMAVASMAIVYCITNMKVFRTISLPFFKNGEQFAVIISSSVVVFVVLHYLISGVHLNLNLANVYDFREANAEAAGTGFFAYLNTWSYQVFNLFLFAICLMHRRYVVAIILFVIQVFLFAASQHKSVLFSPLLVLGVWYYLRKSDNLLIIPASICLLLAASLFSYLIYHSVMLPSLALRRTFFTPAQLSFVYYSFFSLHPKVIWGDSFWMPFIHSPYSVTMPYVIGRYLNSPDMGANNGYVSSGFAQAGFIGVLIYTVILGYALKFIDAESGRLGAVWLGVGLFLLPCLTIWMSSDLATSMLTHGFLLMLALLGLLRRPNKRNNVIRAQDVSSLLPYETVDLAGKRG